MSLDLVLLVGDETGDTFTYVNHSESLDDPTKTMTFLDKGFEGLRLAILVWRLFDKGRSDQLAAVVGAAHRSSERTFWPDQVVEVVRSMTELIERLQAEYLRDGWWIRPEKYDELQERVPFALEPSSPGEPDEGRLVLTMAKMSATLTIFRSAASAENGRIEIT